MPKRTTHRDDVTAIVCKFADLPPEKRAEILAIAKAWANELRSAQR